MTDDFRLSYAGPDLLHQYLAATRFGGTIPKWGDPDASPLDDLRRGIAWLGDYHAVPNTITVSWRVLRLIARHTMPKRSFRRWRGRMKAERRAETLATCRYRPRHDCLVIDDPHAGLTIEQSAELAAGARMTWSQKMQLMPR